MTQFAYTAIPLQNASGGVVSGQREAADERELRNELRGAGLIVLDVRPVRLGDAIKAAMSGERLRRADTVWFFRTLRTLLGSAVPIESAVATMRDLAPNARLKRACADVREKLRAGKPMADAVAGAPGLADAGSLALLRAGQESGRLDHIIGLIDSSIASRERVRRVVTSRLMYPSILMVCAAIALWFLATFVIPRFAQTLQAQGAKLPLSTSVTLVGAQIAVWAVPALLIAGAALWIARRQIVGPAARAALSRMALRTPVVGALVWHGQAMVICETLATMLEGGADVLAGLGQAQEVVSSPVIADRLAAARQQVREGVDIGDAFARNAVLPPLVSATLQVGVKGGDLVGGLRRATTVCMERQDLLTDRLLTLMEPAVILFMAGGVGWMVYALLMGMLAINDLQAL